MNKGPAYTIQRFVDSYKLHATLLSLLLVWVVSVIYQIYQRTFESFWQSDYSTYFRIAQNPELFKFTMPSAYFAMAEGPVWFLEVARLLLSLGFDPNNMFHTTIFYSIVYATSSALVILAIYKTSRGLGARRGIAASSAVVAIATNVIIESGRLFNLGAILGDGYLSFLSNGFCLLAFGLFIRGHLILPIAIASTIANFHAVTGPFTVLYIVSSYFLERLTHKDWNEKRKEIFGIVATGIVCSSPFLWKILKNGIPGQTIENDLFYWFTITHTASPFPISDGLVSIFTNTLFLTSIVIGMVSMQPNGNSSKLAINARRGLTISLFLSAAYFVQMIFSELRISPIISICLHRLAPLQGVLFCGMLAANWEKLWQQQKFSFAFLLGGYLYLVAFDYFSLMPQSGFGSSFVGPLYFGAITAIVVSALKPRFWKIYIFAILTLLVASLLSAGAMDAISELNVKYEILTFRMILDEIWTHIQLKTYVKTLAILTGISLIFWQLGIKFESFNRHLGKLPIGIIIFTVFFYSITAKWQTPAVFANENFSFLPKQAGHPSDDLLEFLKKNTGESEVIYVAFLPADLAGVRRQYLDWRGEAYNLYHKSDIGNFMRRAAAMGIELESDDSIPLRECTYKKRLLVRRCITYHRHIMEHLYSSSDWTYRTEALKLVEPRLTKVIIHKTDFKPELMTRFPITAQNEKYILMSLN
jgi:hypothetical protein